MNSLKTTARTAGALYLALAIAGGIGFLAIRPAIALPGDAAETLENVIALEGVARLGVALELLTVLAQAILAVWFFRLFRSVSSTAAVALAAFGLVNGVAILAAAAFSSTAITVAADPSLSSGETTAATVQLLYRLGFEFWGVGNLFFGLWLIPMGYLVIASRWMPRPLGWALVVGGIGYVASLFVTTLLPAAPAAVPGVLAGVSVIGEFWMIGYLLVFGVRRSATAGVVATTA